MATGWLLLDGDYYYFSGSGEMQTGWQFISNNWYYLAKDTGIMYSSGWHADPETNTMYYFYTWGGAARNTTLTLNGYRVKFPGAVFPSAPGCTMTVPGIMYRNIPA